MTQKKDDPSFLRHQHKSMCIFAIVLKRLGGKVEITQADLDAVAFLRIEEERTDDGVLTLRLIEPSGSTQ